MSSGALRTTASTAASAVRVGWSIHWLSAHPDACRPLSHTNANEATTAAEATTPTMGIAPVRRDVSHRTATQVPRPVSAMSPVVAFMNR